MSVPPAAAAKAEEARRLAGLFQDLINIHREAFPPAERPLAPAPAPPDGAAVRSRHRQAALASISWFRRGERAAARLAADRAADVEVQALLANGHQQQAAHQAELDARWEDLLRNEPAAVIGALAEAFEDNEAAAAPLGVADDEVSIVVLAPPETIVPERMPGTTASGNLSLRKLPKGERAALYTLAVMGHVIVTVKEALAVAAGIQHVRVVALRHAGSDAYGKPRLECILAGRWSRTALENVSWATADAGTVAEDTASELLVKLRGGKELQPLNLDCQPEIQRLLSVVDVEELLS